MTEFNDQANNRDRSIDRQFRSLDRRLTRLEETQLTGKEINSGFDRDYRTSDLNTDMRRQFAEINTKLDIIIRHFTGTGQD